MCRTSNINIHYVRTVYIYYITFGHLTYFVIKIFQPQSIETKLNHHLCFFFPTRPRWLSADMSEGSAGSDGAGSRGNGGGGLGSTTVMVGAWRHEQVMNISKESQEDFTLKKKKQLY